MKQKQKQETAPEEPARNGQLEQLERIPREIVSYSSTPQPLVPGMPLIQCPTSLDLTTPRGKSLAIKCTQARDIDLVQGKAIVRAVDYLIYPDQQVVDETGELRTVIVCCLIAEDGRVFSTISLFARGAIKAAAALYTRAEWDRGILFSVERRLNQSSGRPYYEFRVLIDAEDQTGPES